MLERFEQVPVASLELVDDDESEASENDVENEDEEQSEQSKHYGKHSDWCL